MQSSTSLTLRSREPPLFGLRTSPNRSDWISSIITLQLRVPLVLSPNQQYPFYDTQIAYSSILKTTSIGEDQPFHDMPGLFKSHRRNMKEAKARDSEAARVAREWAEATYRMSYHEDGRPRAESWALHTESPPFPSSRSPLPPYEARESAYGSGQAEDVQAIRGSTTESDSRYREQLRSNPRQRPNERRPYPGTGNAALDDRYIRYPSVPSSYRPEFCDPQYHH